MQAAIPDTSRIMVNVGLGFFVELTLAGLCMCVCCLYVSVSAHTLLVFLCEPVGERGKDRKTEIQYKQLCAFVSIENDIVA
jgi:hypothetical protein